MANPQLENGHIDIAHEIAEAFYRLQLSGNQWRILWVIFRQTYGWHKKMDKISLGYISKKTGLHRSHIAREIGILIRRNIVTKIGSTYITSYGFQKDYSKWKVLPKLVTATKIGNKTATKIGTHKRNYKEKTLSSNSDEYRLAEKLLTLIRDRNPSHKQPNLQTWAKEIDLMIRIDNRSPENIETLINLCQADPFWQNNILSTKKLREKFDQLSLKFKSQGDKKWQAP